MCKALTENEKLSYLAGIVDGEGNIALTHYNYAKPRIYERHRLLVAVTNTDLKLIKWIINNFGGSYYKCWRKSEKVKISYRWTISDKKAENIIRDIYPYLIIKKRQASLSLKFRKTVNYGHRVTDLKMKNIIMKREKMKKEMNTLNKKGVD